MKTKTAKSKVKSKVKPKVAVKPKAKAKVAAKPKVKAPKKVQTKEKTKPNLLVELVKQKMEQQKAGGAQKTFGKFERGKPRNENNSNVGPSWGGRKGN